MANNAVLHLNSRIKTAQFRNIECMREQSNKSKHLDTFSLSRSARQNNSLFSLLRIFLIHIITPSLVILISSGQYQKKKGSIDEAAIPFHAIFVWFYPLSSGSEGLLGQKATEKEKSSSFCFTEVEPTAAPLQYR